MFPEKVVFLQVFPGRKNHSVTCKFPARFVPAGGPGKNTLEVVKNEYRKICLFHSIHRRKADARQNYSRICKLWLNGYHNQNKRRPRVYRDRKSIHCRPSGNLQLLEVLKMMCIRFGKVCFMVFNRERERWEYIRFGKWSSMPEDIRKKYDY